MSPTWPGWLRRLATATGWLPRLRRQRRLGRLAEARRELAAARRDSRIEEAIADALEHHLDALERACREGSEA